MGKGTRNRLKLVRQITDAIGQHERLDQPIDRTVAGRIDHRPVAQPGKVRRTQQRMIRAHDHVDHFGI